MRTLLVDDQPLFLEGLRNLLAARGVEVIGTATDGFEALAKARALRPDVILMDVAMPHCNGLEALRLIKAELPDIKIVMLTVSGEDEDLFEAIKSGASGYLLKNLDAEEFFSLLSELGQGEVPLSKGLTAKILERFACQVGKAGRSVQIEDDGAENLTPRQMEVLTLVAQGMTYKEIGAVLCLTERTVKYHMAQISERLRLENRAQAIDYVRRRGLLVDRHYN